MTGSAQGAVGTQREGSHTDLEQAREGFPGKLRAKLKAT